MVGVNIRMQQQTWIEPRIWVNLLVSVGHQSIYGHHMLPFAILIRGYIYIYNYILPHQNSQKFSEIIPSGNPGNNYWEYMGLLLDIT